MSKFKMNYKNIFEIDTTGSQDPKNVEGAKFAPLAAGISGVTPAANETDDNTAYYDGAGFTDTDVTGKRITLAFSGHRVIGDAAQDYVASKFLAIGQNLKTLARWTDPDGNVIVANVTITAVVPMGGNANAKQTFSFTLSFNGKQSDCSRCTADPQQYQMLALANPGQHYQQVFDGRRGQ